MKPRITDKRKILLAGKDFFGDPYEKAGGWSEGNAIGQLWKRFENFYQKKKGSLEHAVSESGYEVWIDFEGEKDTKKRTPRKSTSSPVLKLKRLRTCPWSWWSGPCPRRATQSSP